MSGGSQNGRWMAALALSLALAFQVVFTGLALGNTESPPKLDPFGNVLCLGGASGDADGGGSHDHSKLPDCCTFACSMFWSQLPAPDEPAAIKAFPEPAVAALPAVDTNGASSFPEHRRSYPRAPPMMA